MVIVYNALSKYASTTTKKYSTVGFYRKLEGVCTLNSTQMGF